MESRIEELKSKYWEGNTSQDEELEIIQYYQQNPSLTHEGKYFATLSKMKVSKRSFQHPGKSQQRTWLSIAATITVGIIVAALVIQDANKHQQFMVEDPQEAYEITKKALMMVSSSMNEGATYTSEIKKINKAEDIITD
ncbi:MAG: hypothetical protein JXQ90_00470 [Cyclobacteriaceae bacterium]